MVCVPTITNSCCDTELLPPKKRYLGLIDVGLRFDQFPAGCRFLSIQSIPYLNCYVIVWKYVC